MSSHNDAQCWELYERYRLFLLAHPDMPDAVLDSIRRAIKRQHSALMGLRETEELQSWTNHEEGW